MKYSKEVQEFIKVRLEQTPNNTQIARDVINKFGIQKTVNAVRKFTETYRDNLKLEAKKIPIKRLFFDIETGYHITRLFRIGKVGWVSPHQIITHKQILVISYKWQYENKVHRLDFRNGAKKMLKRFVKIMGEADECVGHNGDNFDIKEIRTRCIFYGVLMFPNYRSLDTLKKSRHYFNFASNKLDYITEYLSVSRKKKVDFDLWVRVVEQNDMDALDEMGTYCDADVIALEDTFFVLSPFINHNNNFAVLTGGDKWDCPECASEDVNMFRSYSTPMGIIRREMKCDNCKKQYRISNKTYMAMLEYIVNKK